MMALPGKWSSNIRSMGQCKTSRQRTQRSTSTRHSRVQTLLIILWNYFRCWFWGCKFGIWYADLAVGTPSAPAFTLPHVNGTTFWLTTSSAVLFAPVSWVTPLSLSLVDMSIENDTIPLDLNISMTIGSALGTNQADFLPSEDGNKWVAVAVYAIGDVLNVTRTSDITILHFYELFKSTVFVRIFHVITRIRLLSSHSNLLQYFRIQLPIKIRFVHRPLAFPTDD